MKTGIERAQPRGASRIAERLAEVVGGAAGESSVFGTAVERNGITVIPVARSRWGFGGGFGDENSAAGKTGSGGGGGAIVRPLGFIEISGGQARFRRIVDPAIVGAVLLSALTLGFLCTRRPRATCGRTGRHGGRSRRQDGPVVTVGRANESTP
jgi:uncharacterized spore protein YtfJ